jgi:hypothetical protein
MNVVRRRVISEQYLGEKAGEKVLHCGGLNVETVR